MTLYSLVLFLHVASALALAAGLTVDALVLFQLRTGSPSGTQPWLRLWSVVPRIGQHFRSLLTAFGWVPHAPNVCMVARLAEGGACCADSARYFRWHCKQADQRATRDWFKWSGRRGRISKAVAGPHADGLSLHPDRAPIRCCPAHERKAGLVASARRHRRRRRFWAGCSLHPAQQRTSDSFARR